MANTQFPYLLSLNYSSECISRDINVLITAVVLRNRRFELI